MNKVIKNGISLIELSKNFHIATNNDVSPDDNELVNINKMVSNVNGSFDDWLYTVIMPDYHNGAEGTVIGTSALVKYKIPVEHIGVDISCGVISRSLDLSLDDFNKLDKALLLRDIQSKLGNENKLSKELAKEWVDKFNNSGLGMITTEKELETILSSIKKQFGTVGGGNHFIEIGKSELHNNISISIHSGSRGLGYFIYNLFIKEAKANDKDMPYLNINSISGKCYLKLLKLIDEFASANRNHILDKVLGELKRHLGVDNIEVKRNVETIHNTFRLGTFDEDGNLKVGKPTSPKGDSQCNIGILHKGAVYAPPKSLATIPLNMVDGIMIVESNTNKEVNYSLPHGAGRRFSRTKAVEVLNKEEFNKTLIDNNITTNMSADDLIDESNGAYKSPSEVIGYLVNNKLVTVIDVIKPLMSFKQSERKR